MTTLPIATPALPVVERLKAFAFEVATMIDVLLNPRRVIAEVEAWRAQMLKAEGLTAQRQTGKKMVTAEDVRAGLEGMSFDEKRLEELGLKGFMQPFSMACKDHSPSNQVYVQQWDGTTWKPVSDWFKSDRDVVWSMLEQAAGEYVKSNQPWPRREQACG